MHFALGDLAFALQPAEKFRAMPGRLLDDGLDRLGQNARDVFGKTATGDVGDALDRQRGDQGQHRFDVDTRRFHERVGQRPVTVKGRIKIGPGASKNLAHQ